MTPNNFLCCFCRYARKSGAKVMQCKQGLFPELAYKYGKCRRFEPKVKPSINQKSLFDAMPGNEETAK